MGEVALAWDSELRKGLNKKTKKEKRVSIIGKASQSVM